MSRKIPTVRFSHPESTIETPIIILPKAPVRLVDEASADHADCYTQQQVRQFLYTHNYRVEGDLFGEGFESGYRKQREYSGTLDALKIAMFILGAVFLLLLFSYRGSL